MPPLFRAALFRAGLFGAALFGVALFGTTLSGAACLLVPAPGFDAFDTETSEGLANAYGLAETTWTLEAELGYVDRLRKITREQIRDAARRYLSRSDYAQVGFVPRKP